MDHKQGGRLKKSTDSMMNWQANTSYKILVKWYSDWGDFNGHVGEEIEGFQGVHGGNGIGQRNAEGRMLLEFCDERELCVANTWFKKTDERKITFKSGNNESEIDFILISKENRKFVKDVKVL